MFPRWQWNYCVELGFKTLYCRGPFSTFPFHLFRSKFLKTVRQAAQTKACQNGVDQSIGEPRSKNPRIPSMKYWLFDKDPFNGLLQFFREMVVVS